MKNRISIGISSIVLIFLILCLAVFSLLSLSDAKTALSFSERHTDAVRIYYAADAQAQTFIRDYRKALAAGSAVSSDTDDISTGSTVSSGTDDISADSTAAGADTSAAAGESRAAVSQEAAAAAAQTAAQALPEGNAVSVSEDGVVHCDVPLANGQTLRMELDTSGREVLSYYVFNSTEYVIDTRMPVFGSDLVQPFQ